MHRKSCQYVDVETKKGHKQRGIMGDVPLQIKCLCDSDEVCYSFISSDFLKLQMDSGVLTSGQTFDLLHL